MRIIFDLRRTGLGNNGGSQTLVKSANVLQELGHEVFMVDSGRSMYTWDPIEVTHMIVNKINKLPKSDVIIATGYNSVEATLQAPKECGRKYHWVRAFETWRGSEEWILKNILNVPTKKLVNSIGLQNKLKSYNISSEVVYPGYDFGDIYLMKRPKTDYIVLGGLYHNKHYTIKRVEWLFKTYEELKKYRKNIKLFLMGYNNIKHKCDKYIQNPSKEQKNSFYNSIDIWLSTSMQEGLHIPPAEALMAGCSVVTTSAELSGTKDYIINGETGVVTDNCLESFINGVNSLCDNKSIRLQLAKNGMKKIQEIGDRKKNMKNLVSILEKVL